MRWEAVLLTIYQILFGMVVLSSEPANKGEQGIRSGLIVASGLSLVLVWRLR